MMYRLLLCLLLLLLSVPALGQSSQPIVNGDFEAVNDGPASAWDLPGGGNATVVEEGNNHAMLIQPASKNHLRRISQKVALDPTWKKIEITTRVRSEGVEVGDQSWQVPGVILQINDAGGQKLTYGPPIRLREDVAEWTQMRSTIELPKNARWLLVEPGIYGPGGKLWIDDVQLRVIDTREVKPEPVVIRSGVTGAKVDETKASVTIEATDDASLKEAVKTANSNKAKNVGTRILIAPGTYRQGISVSGGADNEAPIVIEAKAPDTVILSGATPLADWQPGDRPGVWTHAWSQRWGVAANPWEKEYKIQIEPIVRRRELLVADGRTLRQVLEETALEENTFLVDESAKRLTVMLMPGERPAIEAGVREQVIRVENTSNVVLRNLTVRHAATGFTGGAIVLKKTRNLLLEGVVAEWNNARGVLPHDLYDVTFKHCRFDDNGANGVGGARIDNLLYEDVQTNRNNWRGAWGGWHGWDLGGSKLLFVHNAVFRRYVATGNYCPGLWLDWDNENLLIEDSRFEGNSHTGLGYEASKGPLTLRNVTIAHNGQSGLHIHSGSNGTVDGCHIVGNASQISVYRDARPVKNWQKPDAPAWTAQVENWKILNSVIASEDRPEWQAEQVKTVPEWFGLKRGGLQQPLFHPTSPMHFKSFVDTLRSDNNTFFHPASSEAFVAPDGSTRLTLEQWTERTGQDKHSRFSDISQAPQPPIDVKALSPSRRTLIESGQIADAAAGPFPLAKQVPAERWQTIDLAKLANRPLTGKDAWIGAGIGFEELLVKRKDAAGVPFSIVEPATKDEPVAIAVRSAKLQQTRGEPVPDAVVIPIDRNVKAIYFLHGAGYVGEHGKIAEYEITFEDGSSAKVPVVALGTKLDPAQADTLRRASNVQDWWPTHPALENDDVRRISVGPNERSVYAFQWINTNPAKGVKSIRITSAGPQTSAAFLLLGVTILPATPADIESL